MIKYQHLIGKAFTGIGNDDCFRLVRDLYFDNWGIKLRDYARPNDWASDTHNLITKSYEREGFNIITTWKPKDLRPGDLLAVCIGEAAPNHLAVVVEDGQIVHHLYGRLSSVDPLRDFWFNQTAFILRHPDVPDLRPEIKDVNILDILSARNAPPKG